MLDLIKRRCGIASNITVYDEDIVVYIEDCVEDLISSGVPESIAKSEEHQGVLTAIIQNGTEQQRLQRQMAIKL